MRQPTEAALSQYVLEHGRRSVNVSAVETKKVKGRHSDQTNRHYTQHAA
jgi:hypothetical protein